jgi:hypothetical protein
VGVEHEVKERDAVETTPFDGVGETRKKELRIPAAEPGNVIGYEYKLQGHPPFLQDSWSFQRQLPVRTARFILQLPEDWRYESMWFNHPARDPGPGAQNQWIWQLEDLPAVKPEPLMPSFLAVSGRMDVTFFPLAEQSHGRSHSSWSEIGRWYAQHVSARRRSSPEIQQKVAELTAGVSNVVERMRRLGAFVQRDVRYVAIEIGIGKYEPHAAAEIFTKRYGDCKDKATLLGTMLHEIGIESYCVLVNNERGAVAPDFPSMSFNHAILAIRLPQEVSGGSLHALVDHPRLGRLLFFDPTDPISPLGDLPPAEQASLGLVVTDEGGELLELPLLPPERNRSIRTATFSLSPAGALSGEVQEIRSGAPATLRRAQLLYSAGADRQRVLEDQLADYLSGFRLTSADVVNLENYDDNLILEYRFVAENYGRTTGDLLLLRLCVLGEKGSRLMEGVARKYPVEFEDTALDTDVFEFALPPGYRVDELPPPVEVSCPFAEYHSKAEAEGSSLRFTRTYQLKKVHVPVGQWEEVKQFFRRVSTDERATAVLKRTGP